MSAQPITSPELVARGMDEAAAVALVDAVEAGAALPPAERWRALTRGSLGASVPFAVHQLIHDHVFAAWDEAQGPRPAWTPTAEEVAATNVGALMRDRGFGSYDELWRWSVTDREGFWGAAVERLGICFQRPPERVLDQTAGAEHPRWLPAARLNIVESCFAAPPDAPAIVSGTAGDLRTVSYRALREEVARVAAALPALGLAPGDAVALCLPMTPTAVAMYLGTVAAGMAVVGIADSMAVEEIATRLRVGNAKLVFTAFDVAHGARRAPLYAKLVEAGAPRTVVVDAKGASLRDGDLAWEAFRESAPAGPFAPVACEPDAVTNVLFSSGTTAEPKAIPWTHLTPIKAATDAALHLDVKPGDVVAWPTSLGWMMGPWLIYATLLNRATMALSSDAPTTRAFGEFVAAARVTVLGVVPTIVKAWRTFDRMGGLDWSRIKCFGSTGEASNAVDALYLMALAGYRPVIEYCGGTELGGGYITGTLVQPASPATFTTPALGSAFLLLDEEARPTDNGEVFLAPPMLGASQRLLNRDHHEVYFADVPRGPAGEVLRRHGDQLQRLPNGYFRALGRVDDAMNLGGIKVSSAELERVLDTVPGVRRTAAIAVDPPGGGPSELVVYAVVDDPAQRTATLGRMQQSLGTRLNPLFRISQLVVVDELPVTASNKILRRELRKAHRARGSSGSAS